MKNFLFKEKRQVILLAISILVILINLSLIFNDSVWYDEAYTMNLVRGNFFDILYGTSIDVHPPLYYFIVKFFTLIFGYSVPAAKLASITPVFLTMLLVIFVLDKQLSYSHYSGTLFCILLLGTAPSSMGMNVELRMYTWAMFFVTATAVFAFKLFLEESRIANCIPLIFFALCAAYTHYFALVAVGIIFAILLFAIILTHKKLLKSWGISCIICLLFYLPWLPVLFKQIAFVEGGFWIPEITLDKLIEYLNWLFSGDYRAFWWIVVFFAILLCGYSLLKRNSVINYNLYFLFSCFLVFAGLIFSGIVLSKLIRPIFVERYMFITIGLLYIFISYTFSYCIDSHHTRLLLLSLILVTGLSAYNTQYNQEYINGTEESKQVFHDNIATGDCLVTNNYLLSKSDGSPLRYYMPDSTVTLISSPEDLNSLSDMNYFWYFCDGELDENLFDGYSCQWIYSGNIDNSYYYTLYKIEKEP